MCSLFELGLEWKQKLFVRETLQKTFIIFTRIVFQIIIYNSFDKKRIITVLFR